MTKGPCCLDCGTRLSQEPWAPELCPRCSLQLALEQSPVEIDVGDDPEALPTRQFPGQTFSSGQILGSRFQIRSSSRPRRHGRGVACLRLEASCRCGAQNPSSRASGERTSARSSTSRSPNGSRSDVAQCLPGLRPGGARRSRARVDGVHRRHDAHSDSPIPRTR